jgi:hypothetical protein
MSKPPPREKRIGKIVFWCLAPFLFAAFVRLFMLFFYFIYGTLFILVFGEKIETVRFALAVICSLAFSVAAVAYIYKKYTRHILNEP